MIFSPLNVHLIPSSSLRTLSTSANLSEFLPRTIVVLFASRVTSATLSIAKYFRVLVSAISISDIYLLLFSVGWEPSINVIVRGKYIQVIYGPTVNIIRIEIDEYIESLKNIN